MTGRFINMRAPVTGVVGFIGSAVADRLRDGWSVRDLDSLAGNCARRLFSRQPKNSIEHRVRAQAEWHALALPMDSGSNATQ